MAGAVYVASFPGCGGSERPLLGRAAGPSGHPTITQASSYARAVNLRSSDLPELGQSHQLPERMRSSGHRFGGSACASSRQRALIASIVSPYFSGNERAFFSEVVVWTNTAAAKNDFLAQMSKSGRACLTRFVASGKRAFKSKPRVSVNEVVRPLRSVDSYGLRVETSTTESIPLVTIREYVDVLSFVDRLAEVNLIASSMEHPIPLETETSLLSILEVRAERAGDVIPGS